VTRAALWLLGGGLALFVGVLIAHGVSAVFATLALAGWGLIAVTFFHLVPLVLDAGAIRVLQEPAPGGAMRDACLVRWIGESANSLMPAGQIGGPLLMIRQLIQRGMAVPRAVAAITVSTTLQAFAQATFALLGLALLGARLSSAPRPSAAALIITAGCLLVVLPGAFYLLQRRGLFAGLTGVLQRFFGRRDWSDVRAHAEAIDLALQATYGRSARVTASFALSLIGWVVGTAEVWLVCRLIDSPVSWSDAFVLESLGQAIRAAAFAVPAAIGVQEGGYLLLAPLAALRPDAALALSLAKRARELLLAIPGLIYLHFAESAVRRRQNSEPLED
jgi:putative membrane protein